MQFVPLLVLRCEAGTSSDVAVTLRDGGYVVNKVHDDETAVALSTAAHVTAVVVDLPVLAAVSFARKIRDGVPALVITPSPEAVHRACGAIVVSRYSLDELVPAMDRMLIDHELRATAS